MSTQSLLEDQSVSSEDPARVWRSLLQIGQVSGVLFEEEIPQIEGVPPNGLALLRMLCWHGPKTPGAIAKFLQISFENTEELIQALHAREFVVRSACADPNEPGTVELAPAGVNALNRIGDGQRHRVAEVLERLPARHGEIVADVLEGLARELATVSSSFGVPCAACWGFEARECVRTDAVEHCGFLQAGRADPDRPTDEAPESCPQWHWAREKSTWRVKL